MDWRRGGKRRERSARRVVASMLGAAVVVTSGVVAMSVSAEATTDQAAQLNGIACLTSTHCVAVGYSSPDDLSKTLRPLIESEEGSRWSIVRAPRVGAWSSLESVSCIDGHFCVAVGYSASASTRTTAKRVAHSLIEVTNDGAHWNVVSSPSPGEDVHLASVSCTAPTRCITVGWQGSEPLAETWNGKHWAAMSMPNGASGTLSSVSCTSPTDCLAGGGDGAPTLVRLHGSSWESLAVPNVGGLNSSIQGVFCATKGCAAVGSIVESKTVQVPLSLSIVGNEVMPTGQPAIAGGGQLNGVSCETPEACVAVGSAFGPPDGSNLVERLTGQAWYQVRSKGQRTSQPGFSAVACPTSTRCIGAWSRFSSWHYVTAVGTITTSGWSMTTSPSPAS